MKLRCTEKTIPRAYMKNKKGTGYIRFLFEKFLLTAKAKETANNGNVHHIDHCCTLPDDHQNKPF